ncbi:MAG: hypothetical protein AAB472_02375 [Patescibacteria group bacterium]
MKIAALAALALFALIGLAFTAIFIAMQFGLLNVRGSILERNSFFTSDADATKQATVPARPCVEDGDSECAWNKTPEWDVVAGGLTKDAVIIKRVASETKISPRLIASVVVPEQIRFFTSEREVFKRYFEPLKILGSLSQFSLGVSGIKQETAVQIEQYASDPSSDFYPGKGYSDLITYPAGVDHDQTLFNRLTDPKDHYYSYLYTALYLKEIESQWKKAGFDISSKPDIVGTLFNIGFKASVPKADPVAAGAGVQTGGRTYAFGTLGGMFYNSLELRTVFPF